MRLAAAGLLAALVTGSTLAAQGADSTARRPAVEYEASVRLRPRFSTSSADAEEPVRWEYERLRLQGRIGVPDRAQARLQLDWESGEWSVDDAWVRLRVAPRAEVLVGQAKRPFTVLSMRSGSQVATVSRGASLRGADPADEQNLVNDFGFGDRAAGVQVILRPQFAPPALRVLAGLFPAEPFSAPGRMRGMQGAVRVETALAPRVTAGAAWSARRSGDDREDALPPGSAVGVDVEVGDDAPGPHLLAEVVAGSVEGVETAGRFRGAHVWMMYRTGVLGPLRLTLEPVVRWSTADGVAPPGTIAGTLVTPGLNVYTGDPGRWNRVMVNLDLWNPGGPAGWERSVKVQLQVGVG